MKLIYYIFYIYVFKWTFDVFYTVYEWISSKIHDNMYSYFITSIKRNWKLSKWKN